MSLVANNFVNAAPILRKRKSVDEDVSNTQYTPFTRAIKQPRRLERYQVDTDHAMSLPTFESPSSELMTSAPSSTPSSAESSPSSEYPVFQLYPDIPDPNAMDIDNAPSPDSVTSQQELPVGVLGLQSFGEQHSRCTQLPRLQVANYPGLQGQRVMYSRCMQCGGISQLPNP